MAKLYSEAVCMQASALCVQRGAKLLLKEISAAIPAGKVTLILGHNGAGKTCLLYTSDAADEL